MRDYQSKLSAGFLLGVTHRRVTALFQQQLRSYEITPEQWAVLFHIVHEEGMIQKQIAELTYKDKPTITRILHQLESKALIVRQADELDRRSVRIYSTAQGQKLIEDAAELEGQIIQDLKNGLGEQTYLDLINSLKQLNDYLSLEKHDEA